VAVFPIASQSVTAMALVCALLVCVFPLMWRRLAQDPWRSRVGWRLPRGRDAGGWLGGTVAVLVAARLFAPGLEAAVNAAGLWTGAATLGERLVLGAYTLVAAPFLEELVFRGLALPWLAGRGLRLPLAIATTSGVWALLHAQYGPSAWTLIFVIGLVLGWARIQAKSLPLVIAMHVLVNASALFPST
jgi:membrane protease YdiL (CAAX protease family)